MNSEGQKQLSLSSPHSNWGARGQWWRLFCGHRQKEIKKTEFREQDFALLSDTNCFCCLRQGDGKAEAAEGQTAGEATEGGGDCWVSVRGWGGVGVIVQQGGIVQGLWGDVSWVLL